MPQVKYPARIVADAGFIEWLIDNNYKTKFLYLMHIKASSIDARKYHNLILEEDINPILKTKKIQEGTLRGAFKGVEIEKSVSNWHEISKIITEDIDKRIILAMVIATEKPYKTYIFTTKKDEKKYTDSPHYKGVKSIVIKSENDAIAIIESFWKEFRYERDSYH